MHIPDAAISPTTSLVTGLAMLPVWSVAARRLRSSLATRQVPQLAIGAAFCFAVMLFNLPVPGGTTVHPVGGVMLAVLLGPEAAILGVTVALVIQALFFGDGGVFALGANCFTMAFAMPVCGYAVYKIVAGKTAHNAAVPSSRRALAAAVGAYFGINVAALLVALILGLQPVLFHEADGRALYFPFGLRVTVPAMLTAHLLVAGIAESALTFFVVRYLQTARIPLYDDADAAGQTANRGGRLWIFTAVLLALSPLGLLAKGGAWGEWSAADVQERAGYVPKNFRAAEEHGWHGFLLLPDYLSERGPLFYIFAGSVGAALIALPVIVIGRLLVRRSALPTETLAPVSALAPGTIPGWLTTPQMPLPTDAGSRTKQSSLPANEQEKGEVFSVSTARRNGAGRPDFAAKTLNGIAVALQESVFAEKWARQNGLLQRLDARVKIITLLGFVVLTTFLHRAPVLVLLALLTVGFAIASRLPVGMFLRRVWLSVPLFVGAVALPAALNVVTPGTPIFVLFRAPYLAVTQPGVAVASLLVLRAGVAVGFVALLTLTTAWNALLYGLRVLFVPKTFLVVLAMTYRYLAVLMTATQEVFLARQSRTVGLADRAGSRHFLAGAVGGLFGKSLTLTDEVHAAMRSRGWNGTPRPVRALRLRGLDWAWIAGVCCILVGAWRGEGH